MKYIVYYSTTASSSIEVEAADGENCTRSGHTTRTTYYVEPITGPAPRHLSLTDALDTLTASEAEVTRLRAVVQAAIPFVRAWRDSRDAALYGNRADATRWITAAALAPTDEVRG